MYTHTGSQAGEGSVYVYMCVCTGTALPLLPLDPPLPPDLSVCEYGSSEATLAEAATLHTHVRERERERKSMDQEVDFAARCLVAMSHAYQANLVTPSVVGPLDLSLVPREAAVGGEATSSSNTATDPHHSSSLFMIARILTDLTRVRQEAVPRPHSPPLLQRSGSGTTAALKDAAAAATIIAAKSHRCGHPGCFKVYGKSSHLKAHLRTHTGM